MLDDQNLGPASVGASESVVAIHGFARLSTCRERVCWLDSRHGGFRYAAMPAASLDGDRQATIAGWGTRGSPSIAR